MNKTYSWPDEAVEILRANATTLSASQILQLLPIDTRSKPPTRNSVIGKAFRLGIVLGDPMKVRALRKASGALGARKLGQTYGAANIRKWHEEQGHKIGAQKRRKRGDVGAVAGAAALKGAPKTKPGYKTPPEPPPALDMPDSVPTGSEAILGVSSRACHWPVNDPKSDDFRFCCAPMKFGERYCPHHKALSVDAARVKRLRAKTGRELAA